jgi:hypothetical protein
MLWVTDKSAKYVGAAARLACALQHWHMRTQASKYSPLIPYPQGKVDEKFADADDCDCEMESDDEDARECEQVRLTSVETMLNLTFELPAPKAPSKRRRED